MTVDSNFFDNDVLKFVSRGWCSVREVAGQFDVPLIKARRSLNRLHRQRRVKSKIVGASVHASRGPRPLKYTARFL